MEEYLIKKKERRLDNQKCCINSGGSVVFKTGVDNLHLVLDVRPLCR